MTQKHMALGLGRVKRSIKDPKFMFIAAWLPKPWVLTLARQAGICWRFREGPEYPLHSPSPIFSGEDNSSGHKSPFLLGKSFFPIQKK